MSIEMLLARASDGAMVRRRLLARMNATKTQRAARTGGMPVDENLSVHAVCAIGKHDIRRGAQRMPFSHISGKRMRACASIFGSAIHAIGMCAVDRANKRTTKAALLGAVLRRSR